MLAPCIVTLRPGQAHGGGKGFRVFPYVSVSFRDSAAKVRNLNDIFNRRWVKVKGAEKLLPAILYHLL
jgi:hypothetical protein